MANTSRKQHQPPGKNLILQSGRRVRVSAPAPPIACLDHRTNGERRHRSGDSDSYADGGTTITTSTASGSSSGNGFCSESETGMRSSASSVRGQHEGSWTDRDHRREKRQGAEERCDHGVGRCTRTNHGVRGYGGGRSTGCGEGRLIAAAGNRGRYDTGSPQKHDGAAGTAGAIGARASLGADDVGGREIGARARSSSPRRLAARLGELEARVASGGRGGGAGPAPRLAPEACASSSVPTRGAIGGVGDGGGRLSCAENQVQSAALRHALLLEERGLQLERAEALLRRKQEGENQMKNELNRLEEASIADRDAWRRLAKAEGEISVLLEQSSRLEELANERLTSLEAERLARKADQEKYDTELQKHASELQRVSEEATAATAAASREGAAAQSSRNLCEQMSDVCRKMREAAEESGERCAESEETVRSLRAEMAMMEVAAKDADRQSKVLRAQLDAAEQRVQREANLLGDKVEAAGREAEQAVQMETVDARQKRRELGAVSQALKEEKDSVFALRGFLKDRDARLERAERDAAESSLALKRYEEASDGLRSALDRSQKEASQLTLKLAEASDRAAEETSRTKEYVLLERDTRSKLESCVEREANLRRENATLAAKMQELQLTVGKLSTELSEATRASQDRLAQSEVSSRAAAGAERRSESLERRSSKAESALAELEHSMGGALQAVEDALEDALRGVDGREWWEGAAAVDKSCRGVTHRDREEAILCRNGWGEKVGGRGGCRDGVLAMRTSENSEPRSPPKEQQLRERGGDLPPHLTVLSSPPPHFSLRGRQQQPPPPRDRLHGCVDAKAFHSGARGAKVREDGHGEGQLDGCRSFTLAGRKGNTPTQTTAWSLPRPDYGSTREADRSDSKSSTNNRGLGAAVPAAATAVMIGRLERVFARIMGRIDGARSLRTWVEREVNLAGKVATEGLDDIRRRWEAERKRLQNAEEKLLNLQEHVKHGGRRAALDAREECYAKIEKVEREKWALRDSLASGEREVQLLRAHLRRLKEGAEKAESSAAKDFRDILQELEEEKSLRQQLQGNTELLEEKASLLQEKLSALSDEVARIRAEELNQRQEKERLLLHQEAMQSQLEQEASRSREKVKELEEKRDASEKETTRLATLLDHERDCRENERASGERERALREKQAAERVAGLLQDERVAREQERSRLKTLLDEERRARRAESAMGEAVLKEVRETQGLLGELSPGSGRSAGAPTGPVPTRRSSRERCSSLLARQASMLKKIVADAAELIKRTGRFYDRYSETHKGCASGANASGGVSSNMLQNSSGATRHYRKRAGKEDGQPHSPRRHIFDPLEKESIKPGHLRSPGESGRGGDGRGANVEGCSTARGRFGDGEKSPRSLLGCTMELGVGMAAAVVSSGGGEDKCPDGASWKELDQKCYSLLESNAQLCLRLQSLGLEYVGLTRKLLDSGQGKIHHHQVNREGDEPLDVADLDNGITGDDYDWRHRHPRHHDHGREHHGGSRSAGHARRHRGCSRSTRTRSERSRGSPRGQERDMIQHGSDRPRDNIPDQPSHSGTSYRTSPSPDGYLYGGEARRESFYLPGPSRGHLSTRAGQYLDGYS